MQNDFDKAVARAMRESLGRQMKLPVSFIDPDDATGQALIEDIYATLDERQKAMADCARIACQRLKDTWNASSMMGDGEWKKNVDGQVIESLTIFERIKDLDPTMDWNGLGLMMSDDPRITKEGK